MTKTLLITVAALSVAATSAFGLTVEFRKSGFQSGNGGEFWAHTAPEDLSAGYAGSTSATFGSKSYFATFCLERTEKLVFNSVQAATVASSADKGGVSGGSPDPLSIGTTYLYSEFAKGTLVGYNYGAGRISSANLLQQAIWYLEQELSSIGANPFIDAAIAALGVGSAADLRADAAAGAYGVYALNIKQGSGYRQDVLVYIPTAVPDGGMTLALLGLGLAGLGVASRRRLA
jgi:hypothetical protein